MRLYSRGSDNDLIPQTFALQEGTSYEFTDYASSTLEFTRACA